jgi:hypothetical protein
VAATDLVWKRRRLDRRLDPGSGPLTPMSASRRVTIGGLGVSGAPGGQLDDDCARAAIAKIQERKEQHYARSRGEDLSDVEARARYDANVGASLANKWTR